MVRIIAKDLAQCPGQRPSSGINDDLDARVGTISFNAEYFTDMNPAIYGMQQIQKVTLFDDVDDDDFDGELGEDDEEMPMVVCGFAVEEKPREEPIPSPQKVAAPALQMPKEI